MQSSIHLSAKQIRDVQRILHDYLPGREVHAFGSRVTGSEKPMSDLDLCIMGDSPVSATVLDALRSAFIESDLPFKVDVIEWATLSEAFRAIIKRDGVSVGKGKAAKGISS